jgi:hypothetical protein
LNWSRQVPAISFSNRNQGDCSKSQNHSRHLAARRAFLEQPQRQKHRTRRIERGQDCCDIQPSLQRRHCIKQIPGRIQQSGECRQQHNPPGRHRNQAGRGTSPGRRRNPPLPRSPKRPKLTTEIGRLTSSTCYNRNRTFKRLAAHGIRPFAFLWRCRNPLKSLVFCEASCKSSIMNCNSWKNLCTKIRATCAGKLFRISAT